MPLSRHRTIPIPEFVERPENQSSPRWLRSTRLGQLDRWVIGRIAKGVLVTVACRASGRDLAPRLLLESRELPTKLTFVKSVKSQKKIVALQAKAVMIELIRRYGSFSPTESTPSCGSSQCAVYQFFFRSGYHVAIDIDRVSLCLPFEQHSGWFDPLALSRAGD